MTHPLRTSLLVAVLAFTSQGCDGPAEPAPADDADSEAHEEHTDGEGIVLEGMQVSAALDKAGISPSFPLARAIVRMGLLWDAPQDGAVEVRFSPDGKAWSDWALPDLVFSEGAARAGHVDAPSDTKHFQYRLHDVAAPPPYLTFQPIAVLQTTPAELDQEMPEPAEAQQAQAGGITIHSREEWGAKPPTCIETHTPVRATIHHTAGPADDPKLRLRQIQAYHMGSEQMCDIAYNFLISRDGRVWRGRGRKRIGGHTYGENTGNIGISFMGNYEILTPDNAQICAGAELLAFLHEKHPAIKLNENDVKGHRFYGASGGATACPGDNLQSRIDTMLQKARNGGCN